MYRIVMPFLLGAWWLLPACAPEEEGGIAGSAGTDSAPATAPYACIFNEQALVSCTGIPGGSPPPEVERCVENYCPERSEFSDTGQCGKSISRNKMRTFPGTCGDYWQARDAGELTYPTCEVWVDVGQHGCSECLQRYCCEESRTGAANPGMEAYLACNRACYEEFPIELTIDGKFDKNREKRIPCQKDCNENHRAASDALAHLRGCESLECGAECKRSAL